MVTLETATRREEGVTFVEATLSNDGPDPRLVRIESRLDGPVWPPRTESVPASGWDPEDGTLTVSLSAGDTAGVGFATPAEPTEPPVAVLEDRPAPTDDDAIGDSPAAVVRALGDPSPPDDALAGPPTGDGGETTERDRCDGASRETDEPDERTVGGYPAVEAWLAAVEERIERAEGTGRGPREARVAGDARRLRVVGRRAVELAERAAELPPEGSQ